MTTRVRKITVSFYNANEFMNFPAEGELSFGDHKIPFKYDPKTNTTGELTFDVDFSYSECLLAKGKLYALDRPHDFNEAMYYTLYPSSYPVRPKEELTVKITAVGPAIVFHMRLE